jgi:ABC-type transport system substrate-binding protein
MRAARRWAAGAATVLALIAAACSGGEDRTAPEVQAAATTGDAAGTGTTTPNAPGGGTDACGTETLRVGLDTDPVQIDPQQLPQTLGAYSLIDAVYDTLAVYKDGKPSPRLATEWTESPDRLTWTLKIRTGATFSDGTPLDANAVKITLNAQRASASNGAGLANVAFVDAPDPETVTVKLKSPWAAFPHVLTQFYTSVISPKALAGTDLARTPAGSGPFTLTEWKPNDRVLITCNPDYWGDKPRLAAIEFRFIPDETARFAALKAGDIDAAWLLIKDSIEAAQNDSDVTVAKGPYAGQSITLFNNAVAPLNDVRVRQALVKALDREALNEAFATPGSEVAMGPFNQDHPNFVPTGYPTYDLEGARKLIADYEAATGKPVAVTYSYTASSNQLIDDTVAAIKQMWEDAGVEVKLDKQADATGFVTQVVLGNYQAAGFVAGLSPDPDLTLYNGFHELGPFNFAKFDNAELSALLDKGRQATSDADRKAAYDAAQKVIGAEVPISFGTFGGSWLALSKRVTGIETFTAFVFPSRTLGLQG